MAPTPGDEDYHPAGYSRSPHPDETQQEHVPHEDPGDRIDRVFGQPLSDDD